MSFRALDDEHEIEVRTHRREGSVDGVYRENAGPNAGPGAGSSWEDAGRRGPFEPHSAELFGTLPRTGIPSEPFQPSRPWSLPCPRDMSEGWVPSPLGTVHGWPPGLLPRSLIPNPCIAPGEQRPVRASECHVSAHMVMTTGVYHTIYDDYS